jgi:hypothetical protein
MVRVADDVIACLHQSATLKETNEATCPRIVLQEPPAKRGD